MPTKTLTTSIPSSTTPQPKDPLTITPTIGIRKLTPIQFMNIIKLNRSVSIQMPLGVEVYFVSRRGIQPFILEEEFTWSDGHRSYRPRGFLIDLHGGFFYRLLEEAIQAIETTSKRK